MSESLAKQITEKVFDLDKVGVGDVVEVKNESTHHFSGIVVSAVPERLKLAIHAPFADRFAKHVGIQCVDAKDADKVRILYRSYHNATGTEDDTYGRR
ncbi:hypothetical protein [Oceanobacillus sojae]|uniref:hypothetical protein n=1 Tax=Oceanobacillus sojae TaxID=582851 RepID=UPI0009884B24|nr:hypothetical protein [Oceanobacillus sojae]